MPTRPSLQRVLEGSFGADGIGDAGLRVGRSRRNTVSEWDEESIASELGLGRSHTPSEQEETKQVVDCVEVIVHEIRPTDSLAGVALKYNVPLATLRRTNKLWASDSIHLRSTLYIPISKKPSRPPLPHSITVPTLTTSLTLLAINEDQLPTAVPPSVNSVQEPRPNKKCRKSAEEEERKVVSADELSFFPAPKSSSALLPSTASPPHKHKRTSTLSAIPTPSLTTSTSPSGSPRPHTLLDIFRSLPDVSNIGRRSLDSLSLGSAREDEAEPTVELEMVDQWGRRANEQMRPTNGMVIQRGGARGEQAMDEDEDWE
ncbi:hypothetical protein DACRYDRAFT_20770 [Dacryopinax primogenitus]|uniref:LysM domain-containing protein n=1 Tax=Dacryopinax primogenitus (strain DJM 731) TaxID=1858805 RepID=M5GCZ6_DACPD|nr:uncharacterized protein DACRYDRAFT_20770 [Dacryopinax primogenitus]EJU04147.1 hypothetical protein DACRYDRAFT_20770 [Dacryopinax primogenitus]